jgi:hypothetical protein
MTRPRLRAASACLALGLVLATTACDGEPEAAPGPTASSPATTATDPTTASPTSGSTPPFGYTTWTDGLPVGPPPAVGYVIGHAYHAPGGRMVALPRDRGITSIARLGDGFLVTDDRFFEGTRGVLLLDARGDLVTELGTVAGVPVLNRNGSKLRWITFTPLEVSPADRSPTRLHVADVATGEIRSRILRFDDRDHVPEAPAVPAPRQRRIPIDLPVRGQPSAQAWEDRTHLLVGLVRPRAGRAAVVRLDTRTRTWSLAVDWTPLERTYDVTFETSP